MTTLKLAAPRAKSTVASAIALLMLSSACTSTDNRSYEGLRVSDEPAPRVGEVLLVGDYCPIADQSRKGVGAALAPALVALAAPLIGFGVDAGLSAVSEALKEAEKGLSGGFLALGTLVRADPDPAKAIKDPSGTTIHSPIAPAQWFDFECLVIARGLVGGKLNDDVAAENGDLTRDHLVALGLADYPAFYLELVANKEAFSLGEEGDTGDKAAKSSETLTLRPVYLHYAQSAARREGSGKKTVTVALALGPDQPADQAKVAEKAEAVFRFNLGRLAIGHSFGADQLKYLDASQLIDRKTGPSIAALITESEEPSLALKAMTSAFEGNKDSIGDAVKKVISEAVSGSN